MKESSVFFVESLPSLNRYFVLANINFELFIKYLKNPSWRCCVFILHLSSSSWLLQWKYVMLVFTRSFSVTRSWSLDPQTLNSVNFLFEMDFVACLILSFRYCNTTTALQNFDIFCTPLSLMNPVIFFFCVANFMSQWIAKFSISNYANGVFHKLGILISFLFQ